MSTWEREREVAVEASVKRLVAHLRTSEADFDLTTQEGCDEYKRRYHLAQQAEEELRTLAERDAKVWEWARPGLSDFSRDPKRRDAKRRQIRLLAVAADASTKKLLASELAKDPACFDARVLIAVDRAGVKGARARLLELVAAEPSMSTLPVAVHLGMQGCKEARPTLDWAMRSVAKKPFLGALDYGAALALKKLGQPDPWRHVVQRVHKEVKACLDADNIQAAAHHALRLEYFASLGADADFERADRESGLRASQRMREIESSADLEKILGAVKS